MPLFTIRTTLLLVVATIAGLAVFALTYHATAAATTTRKLATATLAGLAAAGATLTAGNKLLDDTLV